MTDTLQTDRLGQTDGIATAPRHIDSLTASRGIAALLVLAFHYSGGFLPSLRPYEYTAFLSNGYLWVDFFFLLSGFVLAYVHADKFRDGLQGQRVRAFVFGRFSRIYPLHLTILIGYVILELVRWALTVQQVGHADFRTFVGSHSIPALMSNLLLLQTTGLHDGQTWNGPAWSIGAEWFSYLAFPVLVVSLMQRCAVVAAAVIAVALAGLAVISDAGRNLDVTYDFGLWRCLCGFVIGMMLHQLMGPARRVHLGHDAVCAALIVVLCVGLHYGVRDILIPPLMALLVLSLALNDGRVGQMVSHPALVWLGTVSYSIYMVHMLLLAAVNTTSVTVLGQPIGRFLGVGASLALLAAMTVVVLALAQVLHRQAEVRMPAAMKRSRVAARFIAGRSR
ncbi:acyltransferase family protein [Loktanella fryxellensis]|uniref:acyltransferase family protein n=1 Tax=Loktanella fryxellensis TaxID=245187 RepID=UPI0015A7276C|nr:acyltransferase [Loktanella fryxellensis]